MGEAGPLRDVGQTFVVCVAWFIHTDSVRHMKLIIFANIMVYKIV